MMVYYDYWIHQNPSGIYLQSELGKLCISWRDGVRHHFSLGITMDFTMDDIVADYDSLQISLELTIGWSPSFTGKYSGSHNG